MLCPYCGYSKQEVLETRPTGAIQRRRRQCLECQERFLTYEVHGTNFMRLSKVLENLADLDLEDLNAINTIINSMVERKSGEFSLRKIRKKLGLTQAEISKICGVPLSQIVKIESGVKRMTKRQRGKFSILLDI